jgi:exoribonuclease R
MQRMLQLIVGCMIFYVLIFFVFCFFVCVLMALIVPHPISQVYLIGSAARNRAIANDEVAVQLLPRAQWHVRRPRLATSSSSAPSKLQDKKHADSSSASTSSSSSSDPVPTGRVVYLLQRNTRPYVCTIQVDRDAADAADAAAASASATAPTASTALSSSLSGNASHAVLVVPMNPLIPKIRITTRQAAALSGQRLVVVVDEWSSDSRYPRGHYTRSLGPADSVETGIQSVLVENEVSMPPFVQSVLGRASQPHTQCVSLLFVSSLLILLLLCALCLTAPR